MQTASRQYKDLQPPLTPRQLDVELNTLILAASHTQRPHLVSKLKELRSAVLGHARCEQERGAKETALLREVERVDRAAARIALETERLKRRRDEAMMIVRRLEPQILEDTERESSVTQDDMVLSCNKDLMQVRDIIHNDNLCDDDSEPKLTKMFGKSSRLRRYGSCGSLVPASPASPASRVFMPPAMPLMQNWGDPTQFQPPYEGYPYPYPYMYGAMPPPHMGPPVYYGHEEYNSQVKKRHHARRRDARHEAEMSTDEGENTSNDAGDISSSEASGSGRRRKIKSNSPKPKLIPCHVNPSDNRVVHQPRKSDKEKPLTASTPVTTVKTDKEPELTKHVEPPEKSPLEPEPVSEPETDEAVHDLEDNLQIKPDIGGVANGKLDSSESDFTKENEEVKGVGEVEKVEKKASVDRERKVGVKRLEETSAYQQMLHGGLKPSVSAPLNIEDTSSDDIEAQIAVIPKPRNTFKAVTNSVHNMEDESLSEVAPVAAPAGLGARQGQIGHPVPLGLLGGRLGHPAAQRVGMAALSTNNGGNLSGPENDDDDDDFWS